MADDDEDRHVPDAEEFRETIQEQRRERREQASYEWVETVRDAGELYRETGDVEVVAEELNRSKETTTEALTVYRLIFHDPPQSVAVKTASPAREFFSLDHDVDSEPDEDEPVEDLLREFVGAIYLEYDVHEEPVGDPIEKRTPPPPIDVENVGEVLSSSLAVPTETIQAASMLENISTDILKPVQARNAVLLRNIMKPVVAQQHNILSDIMEPVIAQQQRMVSATMAAALPDMTKQLQLQRSIVNAAVSGIVSETIANTQFPESVIADLSQIQPAVTAAVSDAEATPTYSGDTTTESAPIPGDPASNFSMADSPTVSPGSATIDATLPESSTISSELISEIPTLLVQSMLRSGDARTWFTNLSEGEQKTVVTVLLAFVMVPFVSNFTFALAIGNTLAPGVCDRIREN